MQPAMQSNPQKLRTTEKICNKCRKEGALKWLVIKGDPTLFIRCTAMQFLADVAQHREGNAAQSTIMCKNTESRCIPETESSGWRNHHNPFKSYSGPIRKPGNDSAVVGEEVDFDAG